MDLTDKTLFITGASGGVGMATVLYALNNNAKTIYASARNISSLEKLAEKHPSIIPVTLDITNSQNISEAAAKTDTIDILMNIAGVNTGARVYEDTTLDFEVNILGNLRIYQAFTGKINEGGKIVTITSILALMNLPVMGLYCASKSALRSITQAFRAELSPKNIEVYEVLAGPIDTKMTDGLHMPKAQPESIVNEIFAGIKAKSLEIYPDEYAKSIRKDLLKDAKAVEADFAACLSTTE